MRYSRLLRCAALVLAPSAAGAQAPSLLDSAAVRGWRDDLAVLRRDMPARHANLFHAMTRTQFDSALASIDARLPSLARHQVIVELEKLAALIGDGHSNVGPWRDSLIAFHSLPVAFYWFKEGLLVRAADSAYASLIGSRVVEIGTLPVDSAIARVSPLISRDNEMAVRAYAPLLLAMPEVLHATGITSTLSAIRLVVELQGKRSVVTLAANALFPMLTGDADKQWQARKGWIDARDAARPALWLSSPLNIYWFRYLADQRTLYTQINTLQQKPDDSLPVFIARAIAVADSAGADRFVLDLRLNGGGDGTFNKQVLLPVIKSRYDVRGRLFVITGRRTFSAAQMLVTEMEKYSNATFVGEPTSSRGNTFGDSFRIVMPNSRVTMRVSTLWHQYRDTRDMRAMIEPDIAAPLSFSDYATGRDPALAAIFATRQ